MIRKRSINTQKLFNTIFLKDIVHIALQNKYLSHKNNRCVSDVNLLQLRKIIFYIESVPSTYFSILINHSFYRRILKGREHSLKSSGELLKRDIDRQHVYHIVDMLVRIMPV